MQIRLKFVSMKQNAEELPKLIAFVKRPNRKYNSNIYLRSEFVLFQRIRCFPAGAAGVWKDPLFRKGAERATT